MKGKINGQADMDHENLLGSVFVISLARDGFQRSLNSEGFLCRVVAHLDRRVDDAGDALFAELLKLIRFSEIALQTRLAKLHLVSITSCLCYAAASAVCSATIGLRGHNIKRSRSPNLSLQLACLHFKQGQVFAWLSKRVVLMHE